MNSNTQEGKEDVGAYKLKNQDADRHRCWFNHTPTWELSITYK